MATTVVQLVLLGKGRDLQVIEDHPLLSRWNGKPLRRISFQLGVANDNEHDSLQAELAESGDGPVIVTGSDGVQWEVSSHSYSYSNNRPPVHNIELTEMEQLNLERIEFDGLALTPEHWSLQAGDNPVLSFLASMNPEEHEQFEAILRRRRQADTDAEVYFLATLTGITEQPVRMRFGRCLWQNLDAGGARHQIVLVAEEGDVQSKVYPVLSQLFQPAVDRLEEGSLRSKHKQDALMTELQRAGVLDNDAIARINDAASAPLSFSEVREFDRALDIDDFS
jgi:hypothetical protein